MLLDARPARPGHQLVLSRRVAALGDAEPGLGHDRLPVGDDAAALSRRAGRCRRGRAAAFEITTGERYTFEELERCAPRGELPEPARITHEVPDSSLDRTVCIVPPAGFEERWCELNEAACIPGQILAGCGYAGYVCRGEPAPGSVNTAAGAGGGEAGATAVAGASGAAGAAGGSDVGGSNDDEPPSQAEPVSACACSLERAGSSGSARPLAIAGLLAGVVLLRIKRARRRV